MKRTVDLAASYEYCRRLHQRHGRTYYLATRLLPKAKRRHVHALYGFTRYTDEIVDHLGAESRSDRADRLAAWMDRFDAAWHGRPVADPVLPALLDTVIRFGLQRPDFDAFLRSMAMDLVVRRYRTYADLLEYMEGSGAAIGAMMLPILGSPDPVAARGPARQLGMAFQMTNFIRDVREDLDRDRIYLPAEDLSQFGVTPDDLRAGVATERVRALIWYEMDRAYRHYALAAPGIALLSPSSQTCIRAAYRMYGGILTRVAGADGDVFRRRARVPRRAKLAILARCLLTPAGRPEPALGPAPVPDRWHETV